MQQATETTPAFIDRRSERGEAPSVERRQFQDGNRSDNPSVAELANAVDQYKLCHRRRFITFEELHEVILSLGYSK